MGYETWLSRDSTKSNPLIYLANVPNLFYLYISLNIMLAMAMLVLRWPLPVKLWSPALNF